MPRVLNDVSGTTDYPIGRLTQSVAKTYLTGVPGGDTVTTTQSYEHDARGRLQAAQLQFECAYNFFSSCK
jgi:hypothetical protein